MNFLKYKKIFFVLMVVILFGVAFVQKYPFGVKKYKTVSLGMQAFQSGGSKTYWAPPDDIVPESDFYIYSIGDEHMCIGSSCGMGGYFVECIGGYISGEKIITEEFDYGLNDAGVDTENLKIITVANKEGKIVGIYPGAKIRNLPYIMKNHLDLVDKERFKVCSDLLPTRF
jgi:hypothetical protein